MFKKCTLLLLFLGVSLAITQFVFAQFIDTDKSPYEDEYLNAKMEVMDATTDVAYLEDSSVVYRLFSAPRPLYKKDGVLKVREPGWNLFSEMPQMQLRSEKGPGYTFEIPTEDKDGLIVKTGIYELGKNQIYPTQAQFKQTLEGTATVTRLHEVYPDIDIVFEDTYLQRQRQIVIKKQPKGITASDTLRFWEEYKLPAGAKVFGADDTIISGTRWQGMESVSIKTPNGVNIEISGAVMFDGSLKNRDEVEGSPVTLGLNEIIEVNYAANSMRIGLEVPANYLLDKNRVYPVTVDPTYWFCVAPNFNSEGSNVACEGNSFSVDDFFLRYIQGGWSRTTDLFMGYDSANLATRHPIMKFNLNAIPADHTIDGAWLKMYQSRNTGNGRYSGDISTVARKITTDWVRDGNFNYNDVRAHLSDIGARTVTVGANDGNPNNDQNLGWYSWTITTAVRDWKSGVSPNHGLLLEPSPQWPNGARPEWPDRIMIFSSSRNGNNNGPYLQVNTTPPRFPDLDHINTVVPNTIRQGEDLQMTYTIRNRGDARSSATTVRNFFADEADYSQGSLGDMNVPALNPDEEFDVVVDYNVPVNLVTGDYYFSYWIDPANSVAESNEGNNRANRRVTVMGALRSDLRAENVNVNDNSVLPGERVTLTLDVFNRGAVRSNNEGTIYYSFSGAEGYDPNRKLQTENTFPRLDVNSSSRETMTYTIPAGSAPGTYYVSYFIDSTNAVAESDESNNRGSVRVAVEGGRDLEPVNFGINDARPMRSGERINITGTVNNSGNLASNGVTYRLGIREVDTTAYFDLDELSAVDGAAVGMLPLLAAGSGRQFNFSGVIPSNVPYTGTYRIEMTLDQNNVFLELNENNNTAFSLVSIPIERNGYCGGCMGGGGAPPPQQVALPDTDSDTRPDVVEVLHGTPIEGEQVSEMGDPEVSEFSPTPVDRQVGLFGGDPVNIRTGSFELTETDFTLPGRGTPLDITRVYNSRVIDNNNRIGLGWNISTASYYYEDLVTHNVTAYLGESLAASFETPDNGTTYVSPDGLSDTLARENGTIVYKTPVGYKYVFARPLTTNIGLLSQIIDPNGNTNTFSYIFRRDIPLLSTVTDASDRRLEILYGAEDSERWDKITEIRSNLDPATPTIVRYTYKDNGYQLLEQVRRQRYYQGQLDAELVTRYRYTGNLLTEVEDSRGTILYNEYDGQGRVITQRELDPNNPRRDANGELPKIYEFEYSGADAAVPGSVACTLLRNFRDSNNSYTEKTCFNGDGLRLSVQDGAGNFTKFAYTPAGMVERVTDAMNNITYLEYDNARRVTKETLPDTEQWHTVTTYEYDTSFDKPSRKIERVTAANNPDEPDLLSRTTRFGINPNTGAIDFILDPEGGRQDFTYVEFGNVRAVVGKNGGRTTYEYDDNGNYVVSESITVRQADDTQQTVTTRYGYDAYGNRTSVSTDGLNNTYNYLYDTHHNVRQVTDPRQQVTRFEYDIEDHRTREIAPGVDANSPRVTEYTYATDTSEKLLRTRRLGENNASISTQKQYDFVGNLITDIDGRNNAIRYTYNAANRLQTVETGVNTVTYAYYANGLKQRETDSSNRAGGYRYDNRVSEYAYDARGNLTTATQFNNNDINLVTSYEYDGLNRQTVVIDPNRNRTEVAYDWMDRPTEKTAQNNTTQFFYDDGGRKIGVKSPRAVADEDNSEGLINDHDHSVSYFYDGLNRLMRTRNAQNKDTLFFYYEDGKLKKTIDRQNLNESDNDHVREFRYDAARRKTSEIDAAGNLVVFNYDNANRLTSRVDEEGRTVTYGYDLFDRVVSETDAANNSTRFEYDGNNNRTSIIYPDQTRVGYEYDSLNRPTATIDADGNRRETYYYNREGGMDNVVVEIDKNTRETFLGYDRAGRLISETNPAGTVTSYTYDNNGNRRTATTAGKTTDFRYNALNRVERIIHPGGTFEHAERFEYDANGNLRARTDGNDARTEFAYDSLNRVIEKRLPGNEVVGYTYDNWNNLLTSRDPASTEAYEYDRLNRVTDETRTIVDLPGRSFTVSREYFRDSQLQNLTDAGGRQVGYTYNNRGLLENVNYGGRALATYAYNSFRKPQTATFRNGLVTTYAYDNRHRLDTLTTRSQQQQVVFSHDYDYDAENNRTQLVEQTELAGVASNRTVNYGYDTLEQLTSVNYSDVPGNTDLQFEYDTWGNRLSTASPSQSMSYTTAADSQELQSYTVNSRLRVDMTYDGNGSTLRETYRRLGRQTKAVSYQWDSRERLRQISYEDSSRPVFLPQAPANTLEFKYDDAGNRIKKSASGGDTTYYINAGLSVLNELDARGEVSKTIVQGLSQIAEIDAQGRITFVHSDVLGSAMFVSDEAGAVVQQYDYDPFGSLIGSLGAADDDGGTNYQFTGQEFDSESDLSYFNARYYSPALGRFLSRDSYLGQDGDTLGRNRYNYVKNNPLKYVDPTGNEAVGAQAEEYGSDEVVKRNLLASADNIASDTFEEYRDLSFFYDMAGNVKEYVAHAAEFFDVSKEIIAVVLEMENASGFLNTTKRNVKMFGTFVGNNFLGLDDYWDNGMGMSEGLGNIKPGHAKKILEHFNTYYKDTDQQKVVEAASQILTNDQANIFMVGAGMRRSIDERLGIDFTGPMSVSQMAQIAATHNTPDAPLDKDDFKTWKKRSNQYFFKNTELVDEYIDRIIDDGLTSAYAWKYGVVESNATFKQKDFQNDIGRAEFLLNRHFKKEVNLRFL